MENDTCDKEKKQKKLTDRSHSRLEKLRRPRFHLVDNNLVNNTWDAHLAEVRCTTRGTGCLPIDLPFLIDSLCIGHFTTVNLERAHGIRRQVNRALNIHLEATTEEYLVTFGIVHEDT